MTQIREERFEDVAGIREVNDRAFGQEQEGRIVEALRVNGAAVLSLVALVDDRVVGHLMYSPIIVGEVTGAALAPMAVLPEYQRQGIGSLLVETGNQRLKLGGYPFIIVLGHPDFYPRFGFVPANSRGIECEWDVPAEAFMLLVLDEAKMKGVSGLAKYRDEFSTIT